MIAYHQQRLLLGTRVLSDNDILGEILPSSQKCHELMLVLCHDELKADIITSLLSGTGNLMNLDTKYQEDPEVVRAAVRFDGMQLQYAHGAARKDRSIVLSAIARN